MIENGNLPGPRRSLLFVPGNRPERFSKAFASGTDIVCIDLEDAVPAAEKADARRAVCDFLQSKEPTTTELALRINSLSVSDGESDVASLSEHFACLDFLMVPKTESAEDLNSLPGSLANYSTEIIALIETPKGILSLQDLLKNAGGIGMLMLGGADLTSAMNAKMNWDSLLFARSTLVTWAALHQLGTIDVPFLDTNDDAGLREEILRIRDFGFSTKSAIHPKQISAINELMTPSAVEIDAASRIVNAMEGSDGRAVLVDGRLVDAPILKTARRVVSIAESLGKYTA